MAELSGLIHQIEALAQDHVLSSEDNMSDADSETLEAAEEEARWLPMTRKHVEVFDRLPDGMRKRRYITAWPGEENLPVVSDEKFVELFRAHVKRKRVRRKFRLNPDYSPPDENPPKKETTHSALLNGNSHENNKNHNKKSSKSTPNHAESGIQQHNNHSSVPRKKAKNNKNNATNNKKKKEKPTTIEQFNSRRRKLWAAIMKKEISKGQKARNFNQKERISNRKKMAVQCMRAVRQKAMLSQRFTKETQSRAKRLTREMQNYWKKFDRVEKQQKRQEEKEAEQQQKMDLQLLEAKRQQRKLNFLITQTELYAHFMANKVGSTSTDEAQILDQLVEDKPLPITTLVDDYDSERVKAQVKENAARALAVHDNVTKAFDVASEEAVPPHDDVAKEEDRPQPEIFNGTLKKYQLKGMNWLLNLYDQGINGILADEMGLGKTVQALAMLAHIAEQYQIWGPFLVITPASTLHNWQQEIARFIPAFKIVPYWGSPQERKILRQFWDKSNLHKKSASFHIVITSYQLVITDFKFFNRIKWQYLVLDEAQAIKSSSSQRWKMLLEFKCRNRLLLSGTPIQNTMAELWSLLHFVMPTLFDNHEEFDDWFSKDIESSAESKSQVDEKQITRLHTLLKPFMLRRIKKDVENELTEKLEILLYCPLTVRQKHLYNGLKQKIRIEDLLQGYGGSSQSSHNSAITSSLMNLVMQFRKVCNHPELFERRDTRSPFVLKSIPYLMPKLLYQDYFRRPLDSPLHKKLAIHHPTIVHEYLEVPDDPYAFLRFTRHSPAEYHGIYNSQEIRIDQWHNKIMKNKHEIKFYSDWHQESLFPNLGIKCFPPNEFVFTSKNEPIYGSNDITIKSMKETLNHRLIRSKRNETGLAKEIMHIVRPEVIRQNSFCTIPSFVIGAACPKAIAMPKEAYSYDSEWLWRSKDHLTWLPKAKSVCEPLKSYQGWSNINMPDKEALVSDAGKLFVLDGLLARLKAEGHRVLIYSQMTRMIDLLEEFMHHRKHTYIRLDGSSKIHERRDMVNDFQQRSDIFVFLLSTRAGGLGINLTAADTVIFYDSDWNPTVDQQAMDRAHRLGQTKQVTVYRLICKGTIEERILQRAREKSEIQRMVIQGGSFKGFTRPTELRPKEVVSLLLDDEELERKYNVQTSDKSGTTTPGNEESVDIEGWMDYDADTSMNTSQNTTRAPSPVEVSVQDDYSIPTPPALQVSEQPVNTPGRSKRTAKRPPKRFDD